MKNKMKGIFKFLFLISLLYNLSGYSQDLLNPIDSDGDPWFETIELKASFFRQLVTNASLTAAATGTPVSLLNDAFIVLIKKDVDFIDNNSNETYSNLVVGKCNNNNAAAYNTQNTVASNRSPVLISYFLGSNMTTAKMGISRFIPAGSWGTSLVLDTDNLDLKALNSSTGGWINIQDGLQIALGNLSINGQ